MFGGKVVKVVTRSDLVTHYGERYARLVAEYHGASDRWPLADVVDAMGFPIFTERYPPLAWEAYYNALDPAYPRPTGWGDRWSTMQRFLDVQTDEAPYNACVASYRNAQAALVVFLRSAPCNA